MRRNHSDDLRGASKLTVELVKRITSAVEGMHREIASGPGVLGQPLAASARVLTALAYGGVKLTADRIGAVLDRALVVLAPLLGEGAAGRPRESARAALNAVLGDYLAESGNPLAIAMRLRVVTKSRRMIVMVHGSGMSDEQWRRHDHDHGAALAAATDWGLAYAHYNSGLHISENGAQLAELLGDLPADDIVLIGFSMGGLVARSAVEQGPAWRDRVRALMFLGVPHHGAPLERGGNWLQALTGVSRYSAPLTQLMRIRSAGVTDLRYGNVREEDWRDRDRFALGGDPRVPLPLPAGVPCYAIAATRSEATAKRLASDGLVPVASALGDHANASLNIPEAHRAILHEASHLDLLDRTEVYAQLATWMGELPPH